MQLMGIRDALVAATGAGTCGAVRDADLAALTTLSAASAGLTGIRAGDFAGLDALASLDLSGNAIAALNAGDFDGLSTVTTLDLASNSLRTLPSNAFRGLGALETLDLASNALGETLATDAFAGLSSLTFLDLDNNSLEDGDLPAGVFDPPDPQPALCSRTRRASFPDGPPARNHPARPLSTLGISGTSALFAFTLGFLNRLLAIGSVQHFQLSNPAYRPNSNHGENRE